MKLSEFVKNRRAELGLTWNDIMDGGISNNTFCNIVNGKQLTMKPATMEKLARILQCSIGDIQACMSEAPHPLRKEAEKQEGKIFIAPNKKTKREQIAEMMKKKPFAPDEEPVKVEKPEVEVEKTDMQERAQMKEFPRDEIFPFMTSLPVPKLKYLTGEWKKEKTKEQTAEEYKQELRDLFIKLAKDSRLDATFVDLIISFGKAVLDQIAEKGDNNE